jgi:hypothetical protein
MFYIGKSAVFDPKDQKFALVCEKRDLNPEERQKGIPDLSALGEMKDRLMGFWI